MREEMFKTSKSVITILYYGDRPEPKNVHLDSFKEIRETLKDIDLIEATKYQKIDDLMIECENELDKENPTRSRIGACLGTVGQAIGGIAILGSAYQALKMFVPLFGGPPLP